MTIRDIQCSFSDTSTQAYVDITSASFGSGVAGTYLAPNSIDTSPLATSFTELTAADTTLSANSNTYRELGGGERLWLIVDWVTAATSGGAMTIDVALITSASSALGSAVTIYDFGAVAKATIVKGYRQIAALPRVTTWLQWIGLQWTVATNTATAGQFVAWIGKDVDSVNQGGASGFGIK